MGTHSRQTAERRFLPPDGLSAAVSPTQVSECIPHNAPYDAERRRRGWSASY